MFDRLPNEVVWMIVNFLDYKSVRAFFSAFQEYKGLLPRWKVYHARRVYIANKNGVFAWKVKYI